MYDANIRPMKILLLYPKYPDTFWSFKHALKFIFKKAANPPLGLITIASMLPEKWEKKLTDLNIELLKEKDILWADYVFISAMNVQSRSVNEIIEMCKRLKKKIVAGGPFFTEEYESFTEVDHFVLNEAEITLPEFIADLQNKRAKRVYKTDKFADLSKTPIPDYSLLKKSKYNSLNIQYTRGCPFNCDFCNITALLGYKVRSKSSPQIINELEQIYKTGWRKDVFFVDDNFIGNKNVIKKDQLPKMIQWMEEKDHPFTFTTEASVNLADDHELMNLMVKAGFSTVFVGIETTNEESLAECGKTQNKNRDLVKSIKTVQSYGIEVTGGFIVGFDNDKKSVFQNQIDFIQESGIISAMVGLLNAPKRTKLYQRLENEGRLSKEISGDNTDFSLNFIPKMNKKDLLAGYKRIISGIYSPKPYYERVKSYISRFEPKVRHKTRFSFTMLIAFLRSIFVLGIYDKSRLYFWKLLIWSLFNKPKAIQPAVVYSVYGYHFRKVFKEVI